MKTSNWITSLILFAISNGGAVVSAFISSQHVRKQPRAIFSPSTSQLKVATASPQITQADLASLSEEGYVVINNFLPRDLVDDLRDDILSLRKDGAFKEAKIGQDSTNELNTNIRIAETCFLGRNRPELLKLGENSIRDRSGGLYDILDNLCDSLSDLSMKDSATPLDRSLNELLYAFYPEGGFYRRHRDAIPNSASVLRKYSLLLYLNRDSWSPEKDAGQLRMHLDGGGDECPPGVQPNYIDVDPLGGTLVLFKSEAIPHEVIDTMSERFALVGWFNRPVSASDIATLGEGGNLIQVGMMAVALALVTVGVTTILGQ
mmetsp:Transcript_24080/g.37758  ORF Transcript_24080/g.37758 Transcript_24080/m.37758 type:complete len:318 (-) Transcript_24080:35-988(-)